MASVDNTNSTPQKAAGEVKLAERAYPFPTVVPTQIGNQGIRYDFNNGCRDVLPNGNGAEDQTADRPLLELARWIKYAHFFVGLSSRVSCLAWAAGTPRQFERTRLITAEAVKDTIRRIPAFKQQRAPATILPHTRIVRALES